ncbi:unnamed protein product [Caenorhabditis angaria]|uniref:Doublecortin-like and CAM kinase-like protein n=1 Tax=Caenorhabditis angaria TaxID=860376 RepID=A0A9P1MYC4_9PELO|nr:unnamed protein product [Caenorhabditis angaria]
MPSQSWRMTSSASGTPSSNIANCTISTSNTTRIGGNTLPRAAKRLSSVTKSNIPRFKRPVPPHSARPHSTILSTTLSSNSRFRTGHEQTLNNQTICASSLAAIDDLDTPKASVFNLSKLGMPSSSNGTNTAEGSMTSSMVMDSSGSGFNREPSPSDIGESRDMVMEMQKRCRIGPSGYPHLVKAKRLRFYRNGDQYFKGITYALQSDRVKSMQPLMEDLMKTVMCDSTALPHGIRHIFTIDGTQRITSVDQFEDGGAYVCSSTDTFKQVDYSRAAEPSWRLTLANRYNRHKETTKLALNVVEHAQERTDFVYPRIIKVIRNGVKPRKIVRHLLNKKTARSYDQVLRDLTGIVKLDSGAIRKLFAVSGRQIIRLEDFFGDDDVFIAYGGNERMAADDLLVASEEYKCVSTSNSKIRRHNGRRVMPNRNESLRFDRSGSVVPDESAQRLPAELAEHFVLNRLIGDGNTAVVYEVTDKVNQERRAMKVIARENVIGQEHLIEMELAILKKT